MGIEHNFNNKIEERKEVSTRLWLANEAMIKIAIGEIETLGKDNINKIPPGSKVVIMTTHLTDLDVPIAIHTVAKDMNISIMNMSVHHNFFDEASTNIGMRIAGKDNFIPVDYKKDESGPGGKSPENFNPNNFEPALADMDKGKAIMIAAHNPSREAANNLDNVKGGYGGVYLAELSNAYILPITVSLDRAAGMYGDNLKTIKEKPNASVAIGEPFQLEKIDGIENLSKLTKKREDGNKLNEEEFAEFFRITKALREQSELVIKHMSSQLPSLD
jgi:hypothetical protein